MESLPTKIYAPCAVCFLSKYPLYTTACRAIERYFTTRREFISSVFSCNDESRIVSMLQDFNSDLVQAISRKYPKLCLPLQFTDEFCEEINHLYLFKLNIETIVKIYSALLTENSVIILSENIQSLVHLLEVSLFLMFDFFNFPSLLKQSCIRLLGFLLFCQCFPPSLAIYWIRLSRFLLEC
jgi:hypothetical protein